MLFEILSITLQKRNSRQTSFDLGQLELQKSQGHCKTGYNSGAICMTKYSIIFHKKCLVAMFGV